MTIFKVLVATASAFAMMPISHDVVGATNRESIRDASIVDRLPADHPIGLGTVITPVSVERAKNLNDATLSTFLVECPPGASAMLHRMPSSGYVLVHVLSGTIRASAWHAGVGIYHTGETWVEPAFAYSIATANSSDQQSARALVILVTSDTRTQTGRPALVK
jgi:quercetin dioxygenase-like cupin family protein